MQLDIEGVFVGALRDEFQLENGVILRRHTSADRAAFARGRAAPHLVRLAAGNGAVCNGIPCQAPQIEILVSHVHTTTGSDCRIGLARILARLMNVKTSTWDVVIAGAGPAGLSAALILGRACRRVLLCDTGTPRSWSSKEM